MTADIDCIGPGLQILGGQFSNLLQTSRNVDISRHSNGHIFRYWVMLQSHGWVYAGSPTYTAYVDMTLTRSKVKVTGLLNFRQLAKPCMLAAMTAAPLRGFLV